MAFSKFGSAVLYSMIIIVFKFILTRQLNRGDWFGDDPVMRNFTDTISTLMLLNSTMPEGTTIRSANLTLDNGAMAVNRTLIVFESESDNARRFYFAQLPMQLLIWTCIVPLQYYWYMGLERVFPARANIVKAPYPSEKKENPLDEGGNRDEEVARRQISQGKVPRPPLSRKNTFFKWVLDITLGKAIFQIIFLLLHGVLIGGSLSGALIGLKLNTLMALVTSIFSPLPLASLVGFIVIPAHLQVVFMAGAGVVDSILFSFFLQAVFSRIIKLEFVQGAIANITENIYLSIQNSLEKEGLETPRLIDEL